MRLALHVLATLTLASAYSAPRYPVGYDPDNRARPCLQPCPSPLPCPASTTPSPNRLRTPWKPPVGYDPRARPDPPPLHTHGAALHLSSLYRNHGVEDMAWDPAQAHVNDDEPGTTLCTGIWMGRKILFKTCVDISAPPI